MMIAISALVPPLMLLSYYGPPVYIFAILVRDLRDPSKTLSGVQKGLILWSLVLAPTALLLLANMAPSITTDWKGDTGVFGWFYMINAGDAGMVTLIVWSIACASLTAGLLLSKKWMYESRINLIMVLTLAAICLWRTCTAAIMGLESPAGPSIGSFILASCPFFPFVNLALLAAYICTRRKLAGPTRPVVIFSLAWAGALAVTIWAKIILAHQAYSALPDVMPDDCFIVTAAARGNRRFVGSKPNPTTGRMENSQLARMRIFERYLIAEFPNAHRLLRAVYNRVGPPVARRIRRPLVANLAYVLLKPLELLTVVVCGRTAEG